MFPTEKVKCMSAVAHTSVEGGQEGHPTPDNVPRSPNRYMIIIMCIRELVHIQLRP